MRVYIHYLTGQVEVADNVRAITVDSCHDGDYFVFEGCEEENTYSDWSESYDDKRVRVDDVEYFVWR